MKRQSDKIFIIMFITFLFGMSVLNILTPDKVFSESENRVLQQMPKLSIKNVLNGRFMNKFSRYICDQFVFKDFFVSFKSDIERITLKGENNGVYFGRDGYLLEKYKKPSKALDNNINAINDFCNRNTKLSTYFLLVPNSVKIYDDKLPKFAKPYDELNTIKNVKHKLNSDVKFIDVYKTLREHKNEYIYFRTDHHWTMLGAYYAYKQCARYMGFTPNNINDFTFKTVSNKFYGTYYSKANNRHIDSDSIQVAFPKFKANYEIYYRDNDRCTNSLYESKYLNKKDKYSYFLDGNHSLVTIKSNVKNGKKLIIFKDSYSHCFIPFLANNYEEIHIIDLRYYRLNVYDYIKENNINEALFLYNVSTFSSDDSTDVLSK
ncbi:hypothetical protein CLTEP_07390 [Clostridium tepidiprofundi DSM 19306]|uniref:DHHW protein n=1 Tax=Clostridium tepidiprofundi DSM 19306 TaxID=1121338 RepID=A0A151B5Y7_9CLOT|nr:DHHW family protein [Clostridium tepidiprofundi]KYH35335.1 hypothetical protein CLTEP_07390 [Clostridium tepidiprofundi DSM 19306]